LFANSQTITLEAKDANAPMLDTGNIAAAVLHADRKAGEQDLG
jgi:hypothetical protein